MNQKLFLEEAIEKFKGIGLSIYNLPESDMYRVVFSTGRSTLLKENDLIYLAPYLKNRDPWPPAVS